MAVWKQLASRFYFESFTIEPEKGRIVYLYTTDTGHSFRHELSVDFSHTTNLAALEPAAFALGMAELAHYWKAILAPEVIIKAGRVLGEFVYQRLRRIFLCESD